MEFTRRQLAVIFAGLYCAAGLLSLLDYLTDAAQAGAHLPLAWHVFPISFVVSLFSFVTDASGPLDPAWHVPLNYIVPAYLASLAVCAALIVRCISGRSDGAAEEFGIGKE